MRDLSKLLRVTAARNSEGDYCLIKFRALKTLRESLRERCAEDNISVPVLMEAIIRGFIMKHPSALQLIDDWIRQEGKSGEGKDGPVLRAKEISAVYAEIEQKSTASEDDQ